MELDVSPKLTAASVRELCEAASIYIFHNVPKQKGGEPILMIIDWEVEYSLNSLGCTIENVKMLALATNGITQQQVLLLHLLKQLQIHKFIKGRNV